MVCCSSSCCYFSCCCTYQSVKVHIPWYHVVQPRLTHSLSWTIHFKTNNTEIMLPRLHCHFFLSIKGCLVQIKIGFLVILTLCPTTCSSIYLVFLCLPFPALFALVFSIPPLASENTWRWGCNLWAVLDIDCPQIISTSRMASSVDLMHDLREPLLYDNAYRINWTRAQIQHSFGSCELLFVCSISQ